MCLHPLQAFGDLRQWAARLSLAWRPKEVFQVSLWKQNHLPWQAPQKALQVGELISWTFLQFLCDAILLEHRTILFEVQALFLCLIELPAIPKISWWEGTPPSSLLYPCYLVQCSAHSGYSQMFVQWKTEVISLKVLQFLGQERGTRTGVEPESNELTFVATFAWERWQTLGGQMGSWGSGSCLGGRPLAELLMEIGALQEWLVSVSGYLCLIPFY